MPFNPLSNLRRVTAEGCWQTGAGSAAPDGNYCAYLARSEQVVCVKNGWQSCTHNEPIDGNKCIIKDVTQHIICRHPRQQGGASGPFGRPGCDCQAREWGINEGGDRSVKLVNAPFPQLTEQSARGIWAQTAVVVMDMWDGHPDPGTALRASQLAPQINAFVNKTRAQGALIIHSPSTLSVYGTDARSSEINDIQRNARQRAIDAAYYGEMYFRRWAWYYIGERTPSAETFDFVVHNYDYGAGAGWGGNYDHWPSEVPGVNASPKFQSPAIPIQEVAGQIPDVICADGLPGIRDYQGGDSYQEMLGLTVDRPNIVYVGINTNWCILRRHNGMRAMARAGKRLWLVRDLTDASLGVSTTGFTLEAVSWDEGSAPYRFKPSPTHVQGYNHFDGTDLVVDWIGRALNAAVWTSDIATGDRRFRFDGRYGDSDSRLWPRLPDPAQQGP